MRTKYVLTALALPALFAACTNDDFETQNSAVNSVLQGRPTMELTINASREGSDGVATRMVGVDVEKGGISWYWEGADDKIGAVLVDPVGRGIIVNSTNNYVITNYPFAPQISGKQHYADFQTTGAVVQGSYIFYNRYKGDNVERGNISHEIPRLLTAKAGHEEGLKQVGTPENGGQNFFISPIYEMKVKDGEKVQTNVRMTAIRSIIKFTLKTDLTMSEGDPNYYYKNNGGFSVNKLVLTRLDGENFKSSFVLNPATLAETQKAALDAWADVKNQNAELTDEEREARAAYYYADNGVIRATELDNAQVGEASQVINNYLMNPIHAIGTETGTSAELVYQLEEPVKFTSKSDEMELMVVIPADKYGQKKYDTEETILEDKNQGVFKLSVYTSEGVYNTYLLTSELKKVEDSIEQQEADTYTFARGQKYNMPTKTMIIGGGKTNIDMIDLKKALKVESTEDWNYYIDYINAHYRDYGNNNSWSVPTVSLVGDNEIDVDAAHYFPAFPVKYEKESGENVLNLVGQSEYMFDPATAIFATESKRPTLQIVDQPTATVTFKGDVKGGIKDFYGKDGVDGQNITAAVKLISDAKVEVAAGQVVNFEQLESATALTANAGAEVDVTATKTTKTAGTVDVKEGATVTIGGEWNNTAAVTIEKDPANAETTLVLKGVAQNAGDIVVWGNLTATKEFTNGVASTGWTIAGQEVKGAKAGTLTVKGFAEGMNNNERGIATFAKLTNSKNGTVTTEVSNGAKGNYGGLVVAGTLTSDKKGCVESDNVTLVNKGVINDNGELMAANVSNESNITLGTDPYALIWFGQGNVTNGTDENGNPTGSVVLAAADEYPMQDEFYSKWSQLSTVEGVIETTLDNATYQRVIENHKRYSAQDKETAWQVLDRVTLTDNVLVAPVMNNGADLNAKKTFVLANNAKLNANKQNIAVKAIEVAGTNAAVTATLATGAAAHNINVETLTVNKAADLTVEDKASVIFETSEENVMLLNGKLTNKGYIDMTKGSDLTTNINATIAKTGELVNEGRMSNKGKDIYSGDSYELIKAVIEGLANDDYSKFVGEFGTLVPRVEVWRNNETTWIGGETDAQAPNEMKEDRLKNMFAKGTLETIAGYKALKWRDSGVNFVMYLGLAQNADVPADFETVRKDNDLVDMALNVVKGGEMPQEGTWFKIVNNGTLDLLYSADSENKNSWAYGESENGATATKKGKFNNELE